VGKVQLQSRQATGKSDPVGTTIRQKVAKFMSYCNGSHAAPNAMKSIDWYRPITGGEYKIYDNDIVYSLL